MGNVFVFVNLKTLKCRVCLVDDEINLRKPLEREEIAERSS